MSEMILTLNSGSSSLKFSLCKARESIVRADAFCDGSIEGIGDKAQFHAQDGAGTSFGGPSFASGANHEDVLRSLLAWLDKQFAGTRLLAVGHRIVHGGSKFVEPVVITPAVFQALSELVPLAPLHQPHNLAAIAAIAKSHPGVPQVGCFDTAFHHGQPAVATRFALPRALREEGVRRYGFHGLSYEYIAGVLPQIMGAQAAEGRIVVAHLGSGASLCAMHGRKSVATTMSFTALDGLMMARRSGSLDPGVLLYLLQQKRMSPQAVSDLLYNQSGLLGVSGISDDIRDLLASSDARATEAIDLFVYRIGQELGSMAAALGGLDALVFTAGIGEHAAEIRRRVCDNAAWLGIALDEAANAGSGPCISRSKVTAWIVPTDEDLVIARHTWALTRPVTQ